MSEEAQATEETTPVVETVNTDSSLAQAAPAEEQAQEQDFAVDEEKLPTKDNTPDYQWVLEKYQDDQGNIDTNKVAKSYAELTKKLSDKGMLAPEDVDGYEVSIEDNEIINDDVLAETKEFFKEIDLPAKYAQPLMEQYAKRVAEVMEAVKEMKGESIEERFDATTTQTTLKEQWGKQYEANLAAANAAIATFFDGDITEHLELANNPAFAQFAAKVGAQLAEDSAPSNQARTPAITKDEAEALMARPDYWDKMRDPESDVYKKMNAYFASIG